jgi:hypothetical protein
MTGEEHESRPRCNSQTDEDTRRSTHLESTRSLLQLMAGREEPFLNSRLLFGALLCPHRSYVLKCILKAIDLLEYRDQGVSIAELANGGPPLWLLACGRGVQAWQSQKGSGGRRKSAVSANPKPPVEGTANPQSTLFSILIRVKETSVGKASEVKRRPPQKRRFDRQEQAK